MQKNADIYHCVKESRNLSQYKFLAEYFKILDNEVIEAKNYNPEISVTGISSDSRKINGNFFAALDGCSVDGHDFIPHVLNKGVSIILHDKHLNNYMNNVTYIRVKNSRKAYNAICSLFFDYPFKKIKLIGVTGTNGKTTTVCALKYFFNRISIKCGIISTIGYEWPGYSEPAINTTPDIYTLYRILTEMVNAECEYAFMEVSSHALAQNRIGDLKFDAAVFTNLTGDHLDYHKTMENYFAAKKILFEKHLKDDPEENSYAIINTDDIYGQRLIREIQLPRKLAFGTKSAGLDLYYTYFCIDNIKLSLASSEFSIICFREGKKINHVSASSNLIGMHNIYNVVGAYIVVSCQVRNVVNERLTFRLENKRHQKSDASVVSEIETKPVHNIPLHINFNVPGRLELFTIDKNKKKSMSQPGLRSGMSPDVVKNADPPIFVFVDYAHTDDALRNVLVILKKLAEKRIITVFGCGGDRDKTKRPRMGKIAYELSDVIIITSDNPRGENPLQIIRDIKTGIVPLEQKKIVIEEPDREKAIIRAINTAGPHDIVLIAGKGHESCQIFKDKIIPFDDRLIVKSYFKKQNS